MAEDLIVLAHGGGGALMRALVEDLIVPAFGGNPRCLADAAPISAEHGLLLTTDAFVVKPLYFPGGDIGSLSVYGTVNDLAVSGARPLALAVSLIIEEGLPIETLRRVVESAGQATRRCGVSIVAGDTKVVARGDADELFVTTAGIGERIVDVSPDRLSPGDAVLISGRLAEHGIAVMSQREGLRFETEIRSDAASVWPIAASMIDAEVELHAMRDPTRGGLAAACVELADASKVTIDLDETALPIRQNVRYACDMLGLDPLTVPNEGKLLAFVGAQHAHAALECMRRTAGGEEAAIIGRVVPRQAVAVTLRTPYGGQRIVEMPYGEELPRIC